MPTRMIHPAHGAMHAYDTGEIARLQGLGWSVEKPAEPGAVKFHDAAPPVVGVPGLLAKQAPVPERKKPGRKPKGK